MIVLVSGAAGSGKGQVSDTLVKLLGANEMSFAQPMKRWAIEYFDFPVWDCYNSREEAIRAGFSDAPDQRIRTMNHESIRYGKTEKSRRFLQRFGDFMKDRNGLNFWAEEAVKAMMEPLWDASPSPDEWIPSSNDPSFVLSDWRFPYEETVIKKQFLEYVPVYTVRVIRSDLPPIEAGAGHVSETSLTDDMEYDKKIYNDGTLVYLEEKVTEWVDEIRAAMMETPPSQA